jgi:hypothetical protein
VARIRSTHPGQWRDQDFVECSFAARLLALALRNEADDQGLFEWKPKQIKMACFPADSVDIEVLLSEIISANIVKQYEIEGRKYGAIRNFRLYQRPKTPNSVYPLTDEIREYVCLTNVKGRNATALKPPSSETDDDEAAALPPSVETVPKSAEQMEDVGDTMKEEKKELSRSALDDLEIPDCLRVENRPKKAPDRFDEFYAAYPLHKAPGDAAIADDIIAGAKRYAEERRGQDVKFTAYPATWLRAESWRDEASPANGSHELTLDELLATKQKAEKMGISTAKLDRAIEELSRAA